MINIEKAVLQISSDDKSSIIMLNIALKPDILKFFRFAARILDGLFDGCNLFWKAFFKKIMGAIINTYAKIGLVAFGALAATIMYSSFSKDAHAQSLFTSGGRIANIEEFLDTCPQSDPAYNEIRTDFKIRHNGTLVGEIPCTEPVSQMPLSQYTDELIILQSLRVMYHMDLGQSGHLPWTPGNFYDWLKTKIGGPDIRDGIIYNSCCHQIDGESYIAIAPQNDLNKEMDKSWRGISGNISLYAHEVRHLDGFGHVWCDEAHTQGGDQTFDVNNLSPYGVQWWITQLFLKVEINVGAACIQDEWQKYLINNDLLGRANLGRESFCDNKPPVLEMPANPGGFCVGGSASGCVKDFHGNALKNVVVGAVKADDPDYVSWSNFTDSDGNVVLDRLVGDFRFFALPDECFVPEWYDNVQGFDSAIPVSLADGQQLALNNIDLMNNVVPAPVVLGESSGIRGAEYTAAVIRTSTGLNPVQYFFDWGDGTNSGWLPEGQTSAVKKFGQAGNFDITATQRCVDHLVESQVSQPWQVTMVNPTGPNLVSSWATPLIQTCSSSSGSLVCKVSGTLAITNIGDLSSTKPTTVAIYQSTDSVFGQDDPFLKQYSVSVLKPGVTKNINVVAYTHPGTTAINQNIIAFINTNDVDPAGNTVSSGPVQGPDLSIAYTSPIKQTCKNTTKGLSCTITGQVTTSNISAQTNSLTPTALEFYVSQHDSLGLEDLPQKTYSIASIKPAKSKVTKFSFALPYGNSASDHYIIARITSPQDINPANNTIAYGPVQGPDLAAAQASVTQTCTNTSKGESCTLKGPITITNNSANTPSMTPATLEVRLSEDNILSPDDILLKKYTLVAYIPGYVKTINFSSTLPTGVTATNKFLIDTVSTPLDSNPANNSFSYGPVP